MTRQEPQELAGSREAVFSSSEFRIRAAETPTANHLLPWAKNAAASLFFTLFPADCRICGAPLVEISRLPVCHVCLESLRPLAGSFCSVCGEALFSPAFIDRGDARCGLCQRTHPLFEKAVAYGSYDGGLRDLIHLLKYQQVRPAANVLGRMLSEVITGLDAFVHPGVLSVVPVPLHQRKRAQRGFNQSELIARAGLKVLAKPERFQFCPDVLVRQRETGSQIGLTRHQRRENLRGAFTVANAAAVEGKQVLVVDDVFTTGTTVSECARVLRKAGANAVWVATVARTLKIVEMFATRNEVPEESPIEDRMAMAAHG